MVCTWPRRVPFSAFPTRYNAIEVNNVRTSISGSEPHIYGGDSKGGGNVIAGNTEYGIYIDTTYAPWIKDNNTIHNNIVAGIYLSSSVGTFNRQIWWNDIVDNGVGIEAEYPGAGSYFHAECNWWDHELGPYDPTPENLGPPDYNNNTAGQYVSDYFHYKTDGQGGRYWYLDLPAAQDTSCSS
jgi:hypothetical protein